LAKAKKKQRPAHNQPAPSRAARSQTAHSQAAGKRPPAKQTPRSATQPAASVEAAAVQPMSLGRRISWWALLAMVFLVPIAMSNLTFLGFKDPFTHDLFEIAKVSFERVLGLIALAAWAWDSLRRGGRIRHHPVDWLILAFIAWVAVTTATSVHWPTALLGKPWRYEGLLSFVTYGIMYFLVLQFADHASRVRRLAQSLFWAGVIVAGYGLLQFAGRDFVHWGVLPFEVDRAFSTYGNPDFLGGFLIFSVTVALGLALLEQRLVWRIIYWVGFGVNGLALIGSFTRGAWIGGLFSLALLGLIAWRQRVTMRRIDLAPAGAFVALGIGIIARSFSNPSEVMNFGKRLGSIFDFGSGSGQTRVEIWRAAIAAIKERPILGWGADTFRLAFTKHKTAEYVRIMGGSSRVDNAHDYPLQLASGIGIPGVLLFYGIFVWAGVRSFGTVFRRSSDPARIILGAFWAASAGYLVHLFFGLSVTGATFLLWMALALVLVPTARSVEVKARRWGTVAAVSVIALSAAGIGYQGVYLAADNAYLQSQIAPSPTARTAEALRAVRLNPLNPDYKSAVGLAYSDEIRASRLAEDQARGKDEDTTQYTEAIRRSFENAESAFKDAIAFIPSEYENYVYLATLHTFGGAALDKGYYQSAIEVAEQGIEVMPLGTAIRVQLAHALVATGRTDEARKTLQFCLEIDPTGSEAALALASLYQQLGRTAEALAVLKSVDALAPGKDEITKAIKQLEAGGSSP